MLKVTAESFHEKLDTDNEEIILNGPPSDLRGHIFLRNTSDESLSVKTLAVVHNETQKNILGNSSPLRIGSRLRAGEEKVQTIWHELPPQTPPGTYESKLVIGGAERTVKMIVPPVIQVSIHPVHFSFIGAEPGKTHTAQITISNTGNLPFQIPDVKHIAAFDMDLICRAVGVALRSKGGEGYIAAMDEIAKNVNRNLPDWASAHIEENGQTLAAGATMIIHLNITLPDNTDANKDYSGNMRFWTNEITYDIKSQHEQIK